MILRVKSRIGCRRDSYVEALVGEKKIAIISITSPFCDMVRFSPDIKLVLRLTFDDIEYSKEQGIFMSDKDADRVVEFVNRINGKVDELWVHCDAGISRSSGVAAAILRELTGDDSEIFDSPKYVPNRWCYRQVLDAFERAKEKED